MKSWEFHHPKISQLLLTPWFFRFFQRGRYTTNQVGLGEVGELPDTSHLRLGIPPDMDSGQNDRRKMDGPTISTPQKKDE